MSISDGFVPNIQDGSIKQHPRRYESVGLAGTISIAEGVVRLTAATASTITLPAPPSGMTGALLHLVNVGGVAHVISYSSFAGAGAGADVLTFSANKTAGTTLVAVAGVWYVYALGSASLS